MSSLPIVLAQQGGPPASPEWPIAVFALGVAGLLWGLYRRAYQNSSTPTVPSDGHDGGSVYVLSNPGHDNLVKIGYTTRDAATRARELSGETGVPGDFEVEYEIEVANPERVEQAAHDRLADRKSTEDREFFEVAPDTARAAINAVLGPPASAATRGLGGLLIGLTLLGVGALVTYHPADNTVARSVSVEALVPLDPVSALSPVQNALGLPGAWFARVLIPEFLGYLVLFPAGLLATWGYALIRGRLLHPLFIPTTLILLATPVAAGLIGWVGHALRSAPVGWVGVAARPAGLHPWAGAVGLDLAGWLRAAAGPTEALSLLVGAVGGCVALLVWWGRRPR